MTEYTDDELTRLIGRAKLGDWAALQLLVAANVLPESLLPPVAAISAAASTVHPIPLGIYAWRRGYHDLARRTWANCPDNEAHVLIARCDPDDRLELLRALPDCRGKQIQLAIAARDGAALEALNEKREAGLAYLRRKNEPAARKLLYSAAISDHDEAACHLLLSLPDHDMNVLQTLARHCARGKVGLGDYYVRIGMRDEAIEQYRAAGVFAGGPRLVDMNAITDQQLMDMKAARITELLKLYYTSDESGH